MNPVFAAALDFVKEWEGIDSNHPHDTGGRTRFGISQAAHPDVDVPNLTWEAAQHIYYVEYWNGSGAFKSPPAVGFALFDSAVQHGPTQAVRLLQTSVGATSDGVYGPRTEEAVNRSQGAGMNLLAERGVYYHDITVNDASQEVFYLGWMRRLLHCAAITSRLEVSR